MADDVVVRGDSLTQPRLLEAPGGVVAVHTRGWDPASRENQDALAALKTEGGWVLAVADGAGGESNGALASKLAVESLTEHVRRSDGSSLRAAILDGIETANRRVIELGTGAASTLSVVEIGEREDKTFVRPYQVGDSRVLVVGGRGKLKFASVSHSPVGYALEAGLLEPSEALHHDDLNLVSNMVGMTDMRIEVGSEIALAPQDWVLVASDGLFDNLHTHEALEHLKGQDLVACALGLVESALTRMVEPGPGEPSKPDDVTVALFRPVNAA